MNSSFFSLAWLTPSLACSTWLCLLVSILSCSTEQTVLRCANGPNPSGTGCATAGQSDVATDGTDSTTGSNNNLSGLADVTGGGTFVDDIVASENNDISASDIRVDGVCLPGVDNMDREMGQPCTAHTDCGTCYCYDEAYMTGTGFRFCTKDCSSGPGSDCNTGNLSPDPYQYACLKFTVSQINDYELKRGGICAVRCASIDDCKIFAPDYNLCPQGDTKWDGKTIQATPTCQIQ